MKILLASTAESAIPKHLQVARSRHRRVPDDYRPPYPSFVAHHKPEIGRVVTAYFGVQHRSMPSESVTAALAQLAERFDGSNGPPHWDRAQYIDQAGFTNVVSVAYWDDVRRFDAWFTPAREDWTGEGRAGSGPGFFVEVLRSSIDRYETLFSSLDRPEGIASQCCAKEWVSFAMRDLASAAMPIATCACFAGMARSARNPTARAGGRALRRWSGGRNRTRPMSAYLVRR